MSIGIYKYTNKLNGKIYVGQSNNIEKEKCNIDMMQYIDQKEELE